MKNGIYIENYIGYIDCIIHYKDDIKTLIEYPDGQKVYYNEKGNWHREDGPAHITAKNIKYWYLNDKSIDVKSQKEFEQYLLYQVFK